MNENEKRGFNPELESEPEKIKPESSKRIDIRLLKNLTVGAIYSPKSLEEMFGTPFDKSLQKQLAAHIELERIDDDRYKYIGSRAGVDAARLKRGRAERIKKYGQRAIEQNLSRLVSGQTYSSHDLGLIFDINVTEGLLKKLEPYAKFKKLPDGNYKLVEIIGATNNPEERGFGYNPYVEKIFRVLREKYGDNLFRLSVPDIPLEIRKNLPPGLLPRIYEYLTEADLMELVDPKKGLYRIVKDWE